MAHTRNAVEAHVRSAHANLHNAEKFFSSAVVGRERLAEVLSWPNVALAEGAGEKIRLLERIRSAKQEKSTRKREAEDSIYGGVLKRKCQIVLDRLILPNMN